MKKRKSFKLNEEDQYYYTHKSFYKGIVMWAGILIVWLFIVIKEALSFKKGMTEKKTWKRNKA